MCADVQRWALLMHGSTRPCMLRLSVDAQLDWLGSAVICMKAVAVFMHGSSRARVLRLSAVRSSTGWARR